MRAELSTAARIALIAVLGLVVGVLTSLAAIGFVELVLLLNDWLLIAPRSRFMMDDTRLLLLATVCVPALGGLVVGLLHRFIPERRSHGPPDIIRSVQTMDGRIPPRSGFLSALASVVSLGAGASVGQYGPLAHLGATLGSLVARVSPHSRWMATVGVGCGVAAAISTCVQRAHRGNRLRARGDSPALLLARVRADHRRRDDGLRRGQRGLRAAPAVPGGSHQRRLRAGVPGVHPHRGRRRVHRRALHARHPLLGPNRREAPRRGLAQADAGGRRPGARGDLAARHPRHRQGDVALRGHRPRVRPRGACVPPRRQDPGDRALHRLRVRGRGVQPRPAHRHPVRRAGRERCGAGCWASCDRMWPSTRSAAWSR